ARILPGAFPDAAARSCEIPETGGCHRGSNAVGRRLRVRSCELRVQTDADSFQLSTNDSKLPMALSKKDKLRLLTILLESRHGDLREQNLNRQGKGHFHVSGMGHEALAAIGMQLRDGDYVAGYYRDRALVLGRGVQSRELALDYFAKRAGQSHGRQMPSHYSYAAKGIWSVPTPTGSQLLPGCGLAWGIKLDSKPNVVLATVGDAATRQGDFFEAIAFAKERQLPVLFVVEDNKYGISSPTRKINPLAIGILAPNEWREIDGADVQAVYE